MNMFVYTIYGKNLYCFRQFGQFQQLELRNMMVDLEEAYIRILLMSLQ